MNVSDKFILDEMESALVAMQSVPTDDVDGAKARGLAGCYVFRPATRRSSAELLHGRMLAIHLRVDQLSDLADLRWPEES